MGIVGVQRVAADVNLNLLCRGTKFHLHNIVCLEAVHNGYQSDFCTFIPLGEVMEVLSVISP